MLVVLAPVGISKNVHVETLKNMIPDSGWFDGN